MSARAFLETCCQDSRAALDHHALHAMLQQALYKHAAPDGR